MRIGPLGLPELLIILLVVLLIFGPRRLPDMAKGLGQSVREFRKGLKDMKEDFESEVNSDDSKKTAAPSQAKAAPATPAAEAEQAPSQSEVEAVEAKAAEPQVAEPQVAEPQAKEA